MNLRYLLNYLLCFIGLHTAQAQSTFVLWDFNSGIDYWKTVGDWRPDGANGAGGSGALWGFYLGGDNFAASPGVQLTAGQSYTVSFTDDAKTNNVPVRVLMAPQQALVDTTFVLAYKSSSTADFAIPRTGVFTPTRTGVYHLIIRYDGTQGYYQKLYFDNIRISGNLNIAPLAKITYPATATLTAPTGATISLQSQATDPDGSVARVAYYANGQLIGQATTAPYAFDWSGFGVGTFDVQARAVDNAGASVGYVPLRVVAVPNTFTTASYLGGSGDADEVRGVVIQQNGAVVLAANVGPRDIPGLPVRLLNGATATSAGVLLKLTADGRSILAVTRLATRITDLTADTQDNLYVAAGADGYLKLNASADTVLWKQAMPTGRYAYRTDAGPTGINAVLTSTSTDPDGQLSSTDIRVFTGAGTLLSTQGAVSQYSSDVAVDEVSQTIVSVGFKNFNARTSATAGGTEPVYVPVIRGRAYDGTQKYVLYDWEASPTLANGDPNPRWLNRPENNMADVRAWRATIGRDGRLYVSYEVAGGNHVLRYSPFDVAQKAALVGGDQYFTFNNTGTELKLFVGRHEPGTGQYLLGQQFTARLPNTKGNTVFTKYGALDADEDGRVYVTGSSAYGLPLTIDHHPGDYTGGAFLLVLSPDFATREAVLRLTTDGRGHALAVRNRDYFAWGGMVKSTLYTAGSLQGSPASATDGWFAVLSRTALSRCVSAGIRETLGSGFWHAPALWSCGLLPTLQDQTVVRPGHVVTIQRGAMAGSLWQQGRILFRNGGQLRLGK